MAMTMTAAGGGDWSDSDDHELPEKEPEFVVHIVDDHYRPPAPPRHMYRDYRPLPAAVPRFPPAAAQLGHGGYGGVGEDGPKECMWCFTIKFVHFALVMFMALVTVSLAARLPAEYRAGDSVFLLVGPIVIGVTAFSWILLAIFDKERC